MSAEILYSPPPAVVAGSRMTRFREWVSHETGMAISDDRALHDFSVRDVARFWGLFAGWAGVRLGGASVPVLAGDRVETAVFFPAATLSYVDHLLRPPGTALGPATEAVIGLDETGAREVVTRGDLAASVARVGAALRRLGVRPGDRVVGLVRNVPRTLALYLGALSVGAVWSSAAPDMGTDLLLARAGQVSPSLLFVDETYPYHGAWRDNRSRIDTIARAMAGARVVTMDEVAAWTADAAHDAGEETVPELPFNHPLLILFSSGTTGPPKCIVHGAGGTLLEHWKELALHCDLGPADRIFFHTTTGWMMYNWLVSAMVTGATIVLYDGSVSHPEPDSLLRAIGRERVTVFGTSPTYMMFCRDAGIAPAAADLSSLRLVLSTGSVLFDGLFDWAREHLGAIPVHSISGGTDIVGCFVLGSPNQPVTRGESPALSLGLDVRAAARTDDGAVVLQGAPASGSVFGELVCAQPFPSRPLGLFGDPGGERFHEAYFAQHEGVWTHGDAIELTSRGTARVLGRSDGVLNVRGVRVGPGEIYRVLEAFPEVRAAAAVEQRAPDEPGGSRLVLLVVLAEPGPTPRPLALRIKKALATRASAAHVPSVIVAVSALPRTHNGKLSERAARDAVNGDVVRNAAALANPDVLQEIAGHPELCDVRVARDPS